MLRLLWALDLFYFDVFSQILERDGALLDSVWTLAESQKMQVLKSELIGRLGRRLEESVFSFMGRLQNAHQQQGTKYEQKSIKQLYKGYLGSVLQLVRPRNYRDPAFLAILDNFLAVLVVLLFLYLSTQVSNQDMFHQIVVFELGVLDDFVAKVTPSPEVLWSKYIMEILDNHPVEYPSLTPDQQTVLNLHYLCRLQKMLSPGLTLRQHLDAIFRPDESALGT